MGLVFGGDAGIQEKPFSGFAREVTRVFNEVADTVSRALRGKAPPAPPKEFSYVDNGFENVPGTAFVGSTVDGVDDIKTRRISTQEPHATVYVKKRAFWGLGEENDSNFMDSGEKLFMRASKILFEKKCHQIAAYEAMTKASRLVSEDADLDAEYIGNLIEIIKTMKESATKTLEDEWAAESLSVRTQSFATEFFAQKIEAINEKSNKMLSVLEDLQRKQSKLRQATHTTWVIDPDQKDIFNLGRGSGVIELTLFDSVNTSLGIESEGNFSLSIQDPYNLCKITTDDVEIALAAAQAEMYIANNSKFVDYRSASTLLDLARKKEQELRRIRENKIASLFGFDKTIVGNSLEYEIIFEVNPSSSAKNPVVAYTSALGSETFDKNSFRLALLRLPSQFHLDAAEDRLVTEVFNLLEQYTMYIKKLNSDILATNQNEDFKYARRMVRLHYLGKSIIQPMDSVHIYMRGNMVRSNEILGPLSGILNKSGFIKNIEQDINVSDAVLKEEMSQFGIANLDLPVDFYRAIRTGSLMRNAGIHVFGGVVSSVSESYSSSSGAYTLNVTGQSNLKWLNLSRVNTKPSLNQPQGMLEDPITPLKFDIDPYTGMIKDEPEWLDENLRRMQKQLMFFKDGSYPGKPVTVDKINQDSVPIGNTLQTMWQHAPGMVYKWKQGVMVKTLDANLSGSLQGGDDDTTNIQRYVGLNVVEQPFAGMDAADIISLLVTGFPHSADRFYQNSIGIGTFSEAGTNASPSYFHSFFDITRSTNKTLGNFEPFRSVEIEGSAYAQRLSLQQSLKEGYQKIDGLRSQLAKFNDQLLLVGDKPKGTPDNNAELELNRTRASKGLKIIVDNLKKQIETIENKIVTDQENAEKSGLIKKTTGIAFRLDEIPSGLPSDAQKENEEAIRTKNKILQLRTQYDCKFNQDKNLFIISDKYDNDKDIQAFVTKLKQQQNLFNSDYQFPLEICRTVAKTVDMEFYCNSQGHIVFRPPQYNRVPLSLVLKMFLLNTKKKIQLFPDFLRSIFNTRLKSLEDERDILTHSIKINSLLLGVDLADDDLADLISSHITKEDVIGGGLFVTKRGTGLDTKTAEAIAKEIVKSSKAIFNKTGKESYYTDEKKVTEQVLAHNDPNNTQINSVRNQTASMLTSLVGKKQQVETLLKRMKSQESQYEHEIKDFSKEKISSMLEPFQDLIEDDYNDFLGPGSSKRFIIYDDQLISYNFNETDSNAICRVDVNGEIDLIGSQAGEIASGVPSVWAGATDFDIWRMYGYRAMGPQNKPFLKDAVDQCAPYALFLLARARKDILRGSVTVAGNEYYQVGDVVYLNSRDMLFYVWNVSHNFSYSSGSFTTTLDLRYGHTLGEYIPTPLDVIGKTVIRNQVKFNKVLINRKTEDPVKGVHLGLVKFEPKKEDDPFAEMLTEPYAYPNVKALKRSLLLARKFIVSSDKESFPKVEVRGWYFNSKDKNKIQQRIDAVVRWLGSPRGRKYVNTNPSQYIEIEQIYYSSKLIDTEITNKISDLEVAAIDLSKGLKDGNLKRVRTPSEQVYNATEDGDPTDIIEIVLLLNKIRKQNG